MEYKIGMYDWNGTIADDPHICHECVAEIFRIFAPTVSVPTFKAWRADHGATRFFDYYYERGIDPSVTVEMMRGVWSDHYHSLMRAQAMSVREGVEELLMLCREKQVENIIVSSSIDDVEWYLRRAGIHRYFEEVQLKVPNKKNAFLETMQRHGVSPEEAFYIDDTFDGVNHAKEAGLTTFGLVVGCQEEERVRAAHPDHVVSSFHEIGTILRAA